MHAPLALTVSAVQFAEAAGNPTTKQDWALIAIIGTVIGGLVLAFILATTKRGAAVVKRKRDLHNDRAAQQRLEQTERRDRIATDMAERTRENREAEARQVEQEQLVQLHATGGQRVVRHKRHPSAPGATVAHFSDGRYGIYFNSDMVRYKAFVESNPSEWRHSHPWPAPPVGKELRPQP